MSNLQLHPTISAWYKDPEFQALPDKQKEEIIGSFFDNELSDAGMPEDEYGQLKQEFVTDHLRGPENPYDRIFGATEQQEEEEKYDISGGLKTLGGSVLRAPVQGLKVLLSGMQGIEGASAVDNGIVDKTIDAIDEWGQNRLENLEDPEQKIFPGITKRDAAEAEESFGYTLGAGVPGALAGVGVGALTAPTGPGAGALGWGAGAGVSGGITYRSTGYKEMKKILKAINEAHREEYGTGLTAELEEQFKEQYAGQVAKASLWESGLETASNVFGLKMITAPLVNVFGKKLAARVAGKITSMGGVELGTEIGTGIGQSQALAGTPGNEDVEERSFTDLGDIKETAKEVAPGVALNLLVTGGGVAGINRLATAPERREAKDLVGLVDAATSDDKLKTIPRDQFEDVYQAAKSLAEKRPDDEKVQNSLATLTAEKKAREGRSAVGMEAFEAFAGEGVAQEAYDAFITNEALESADPTIAEGALQALRSWEGAYSEVPTQQRALPRQQALVPVPRQEPPDTGLMGLFGQGPPPPPPKSPPALPPAPGQEPTQILDANGQPFSADEVARQGAMGQAERMAGDTLTQRLMQLLQQVPQQQEQQPEQQALPLPQAELVRPVSRFGPRFDQIMNQAPEVPQNSPSNVPVIEEQAPVNTSVAPEPVKPVLPPEVPPTVEQVVGNAPVDEAIEANVRHTPGIAPEVDNNQSVRVTPTPESLLDRFISLGVENGRGEKGAKKFFKKHVYPAIKRLQQFGVVERLWEHAPESNQMAIDALEAIGALEVEKDARGGNLYRLKASQTPATQKVVESTQESPVSVEQEAAPVSVEQDLENRFNAFREQAGDEIAPNKKFFKGTLVPAIRSFIKHGAVEKLHPKNYDKHKSAVDTLFAMDAIDATQDPVTGKIWYSLKGDERGIGIVAEKLQAEQQKKEVKESKLAEQQAAKEKREAEKARKEEQKKKAEHDRLWGVGGREAKFNPQKHSLTQFVRIMGGISMEKEYLKGELKRLREMPGGISLMNNKTGRTLDSLAEAADGAGFPVKDEDGSYSLYTLLELLEADANHETVGYKVWSVHKNFDQEIEERAAQHYSELEAREQELRDEGYSEEEIRAIEAGIKEGIENEVAGELKEEGYPAEPVQEELERLGDWVDNREGEDPGFIEDPVEDSDIAEESPEQEQLQFVKEKPPTPQKRPPTQRSMIDVQAEFPEAGISRPGENPVAAEDLPLVSDPKEKAAEKAQGKLFGEEQKEESQDDDIPFSISTERGNSITFTPTSLESSLSPLLAKWKGAPPIFFLEKQKGLPPHIQHRIGNKKGIRGAYDRKTGAVYLVTENISNIQEAQAVLIHEVVGHMGLEGITDTKTFEKILNDTYLKFGRSGLADIAKKYRLNLDNRKDRLTAAREKLAEIAETSETPNVMQRVIAAIREWMKQAGFTLKLSDNDIKVLVGRASLAVQRGDVQAGGGKGSSLAKSLEKAGTFYSQMQQVLSRKLPGTSTPENLKELIGKFAQKGEYKQEELEWSGVEEWLDSYEKDYRKNKEKRIWKNELHDKNDPLDILFGDWRKKADEKVLNILPPKITKNQVLEFLAANEIQVEEVERSDGDPLSSIGWARYTELGDRGYNNLNPSEQEEFDSFSHKFDSQKKTKFAQYQTPGGENYRELLLTLPSNKKTGQLQKEAIDAWLAENGYDVDNMTVRQANQALRDVGLPEGIDGVEGVEDFRSSHWNEPNVLAHVRFNERTDSDGKRVLFIEEVQSDWHQSGRKEGYDKGSKPSRVDEFTIEKDFSEDGEQFWIARNDRGEVYDELQGDTIEGARRHLAGVMAEEGSSGAVPNAPFKTTWPLLTIKRMIRFAAENGFDRIAWTPGEEHFNRWGSEEVAWEKQGDGWRVHVSEQAGGRAGGVDIENEARIRGLLKESRMRVNDKDQFGRLVKEVLQGDRTKEDLTKLVDRIWDRMQTEEVGTSLPRKEGMESFYDKMLPNEVNKYVKKWGAKVGTTKIDGMLKYGEGEAAPEQITAHSLDITEAMKDAALYEGQPMFQVSAYHGSPHKFDKFTTEKMGTGEGVQAFGWGMYFTELEEIAKHYANINITQIPNEFKTEDGLTVKNINGSWYINNKPTFYDNAANLWKKANKGRNLYKVTLHKGKDPSEYTWLDWDKPLSEQPEKTREILEKTRWLWKQYAPHLKDSERNGVDIYFGMQEIDKWSNADKAGISRKDWRSGTPEQSASLYLLSQGIDGIRYPAGSLSGMKSDAKNYVVFDENAVEVEEATSFSIADQSYQNITNQHKNAANPKDPDSVDTSKEPTTKQAINILRAYLEATAATLSAMKPENQPSMGIMEKILRSPEWYSHKTLRKIVGHAIDRNEIYHANINGLNTMPDGETVTEATKKLAQDGISKTAYFTGKRSKKYKQLEKIIDEGDRLKKDPKKYEAELRANGVSEDVIAVWKMHRVAYDRALDKLLLPMKELFIKVKGSKQAQIFDDLFTVEDRNGKAIKMSLNQAINAMEKWRGSYAPRLREADDWEVTGYRKSADGSKRFIRKHAKTLYKSTLLKNELESEGWTIEKVQERKTISEGTYQTITVMETAKFLEKAVKGVDTNDTANQIKLLEAVLATAGDLIKARGFRSHGIHRRVDTVVEGYIKDPSERLVRYLSNISAGIAKAQTAQLMTKEFFGEYVDGERKGGISQETDKRAYEVGRRYIEEQLRNTDRSDRFIATAKSIATFKYLGTNPRSILVNMTSLATTAPAAIHQYATDGKGDFTAIAKEMMRSMKDYGKFLGGKPPAHLTEGEKNFLEEVRNKEYDQAQFAREATGTIQDAHGKIWSKLLGGAMWGFQKSEQWVRGSTMLAAYRMAAKSGVTSEQELSKLAVLASNRAHGIYGKATLPIWAQGNNIAEKVGQMLYIYAKFPHNYVQMLYDLGMKKRNIKAFVWAIAAPTIISGAVAIPFRDIMIWFLNGVLSQFGNDDDVEKWVWDEVRDSMGPGAEKALRYGLAGAAGLDLSGSFSVGVGVPSKLLELTGVVGGIVDDVSKASRYAKIGDYSRAIEKALPSGIGNIMRAIRELSGVTTSNNRPVWNDDGTPYAPSKGETALRGLGFRSSGQATMAARTWESKRQKERYEGKKNSIYERIRVYTREPDQEEWQAIMDDIAEFNKDVAEGGFGDLIPMITMQSIKRQLNGMRRPTKGQRALLQ